MLLLPAPLLPAPFVYSLMPSTNIELLLMLVTMLDIVKQEKKIPKNQDQSLPLSGAQSTKGEKYNKINDNTLVSSIRETFIK